MKALIDTNVIVDALTDREPFADTSDRVIQKCADGSIEGYVAAHTVTTIFYLLRKTRTPAQRRSLLRLICSMLTVIPVDGAVLNAALDDDAFTDFEDCVQYHCAMTVGCDCIITRNPRDFTGSAIPVIQPEDMLNADHENGDNKNANP